ncbi:bacterial transcriptional activator domain-containing protein [Streptomyces sp. NPDC001787]|uniref:AfsR/SARP family transcriptional regulator n=1 Tax=Streptomyces sp. NPDC001787 TaxID=3154523 RepID=UPI003319B373
MDDALWPDRMIRSDTRNTTTSRLRAWLGPAHFPVWTPATNYALAPSVTSDWEQFRALTAAAQGDDSLAGTRRLRAALELVQGPPFADVIRPDRYEWAAPYAVEMTAAIARVTRRLTRRYLDGGDLPGARWSVQRGFRALPGGPQRHQAALEAVTESYSEHDGLQELADQLTQDLVPMTPPQATLLPELFHLSRIG